MSDTAPIIPSAVYTIWSIALIITLVVFVPLAVYLLHRAWLAARSIERYAAETLTAAAGIVTNTRSIAALDTTIGVADQLLDGAGSVVQKLDTTATVLAKRVR